MRKYTMPQHMGFIKASEIKVEDLGKEAIGVFEYAGEKVLGIFKVKKELPKGLLEYSVLTQFESIKAVKREGVICFLKQSNIDKK